MAVNGRAATPIEEGLRRYTIPLLSQESPAGVEVVFRIAPSAAAEGEATIPLPTLADVPVDRSLCRFVGGVEGRPDDEEGSWTALGEVEYELFCGKGIADLVRSALEPYEGPVPAGAAAWISPWVARLRDAHAAVSHELGAAGAAADRAVAAEAESLLEEVHRFENRLGVESPGEDAGTGAPAPPWPPAGAFRPAARQFMTAGALGAVKLIPSADHGALSGTRLGGLVLLACAFPFLVWGLSRGVLADWLARWTAAAGVLLGLAWWLWLRPSPLGWLIVAVSLAAALFPGWSWQAKGHLLRYRPPDSAGGGGTPR
jgi:hypothetical protein